MTGIVRKKSAVQKTLLEEVRNNITALKDSSAKTRALGICDTAISIYTKLSKIVVTEDWDCLQKQGLAQEIANLHVQAQTLYATSNKRPHNFPRNHQGYPKLKVQHSLLQKIQEYR